MTTTTTATTRPALARRAIVVAVAVAAALAVWALARLAGVTLSVRQGGTVQTVGPAAVLLTSLFAGLVGWALLALLTRLTRRGRGIWTGTAITVLALSLAGPLGGGIGTTAKLCLLCLHLTVGLVLIIGLRRATRTG
jgi:hypothetical protein